MADEEQTTQDTQDKPAASSPQDKHDAYLQDLKRLAEESKINEFGKTVA